MQLVPDTVTNWHGEVAVNQVVLCYLPIVNPHSFVHVAFWKGSFDVRDYVRSGTKKLRDVRDLTLSTLSSKASSYVLRVRGRVSVEDAAIWEAEIHQANASYLQRACQQLPSTTNGHSQTVHEDVKVDGACYGLTTARANRLQQNLGTYEGHRDLTRLPEDSAVIHAFMQLDRARQVKLELRQRDVSGNWRPFSALLAEVSRNTRFGDTRLNQLAPFRTIDPFAHCITFELQLNNNRAIGSPTVKTNQADVVIIDVRNKQLYVVEAKLHTTVDHLQLVRSMEAIKDLTQRNPASNFYGFNGQLIVLDMSRTPIHVEDEPVAVITWAEMQDVLRAGS